MSLKPGLYDQPVTERVAAELEAIAEELIRSGPVEPSRSAELLSRVFHERLVRVLESIGGEDRVERQLQLINELLDRIGEEAAGVVLQRGTACGGTTGFAPSSLSCSPSSPIAPGARRSRASIHRSGRTRRTRASRSWRRSTSAPPRAAA